MNGQTPPKRKRATRPDPHPTEVPRPKRTRAAAPRPAAKPATEAPNATPAPPAIPPAQPVAPPATPGTPPIAVFAPAPLPDRMGDLSPAVSPRQLAFMALLAAVILAVIRRLVGRGRGSRG